MKHIINHIKILTVLCAALGWWGLLYPELTLTPDTLKIISVDESGNECQMETEQNTEGRLYLSLLEAGPENIRFRSRLLQEINAFWEAHLWDTSTRN